MRVDIETAPVPIKGVSDAIAFPQEHSLTCSHESSKEDHEGSDATLGDGDEEQRNSRSTNDAKSNRQSTETNLDRIISCSSCRQCAASPSDNESFLLLTIHVKHLCGPEEQHRKVVAAAQKGDQENQDHGSLSFVEQLSWHHGIFGETNLVDEEKDDETNT